MKKLVTTLLVALLILNMVPVFSSAETGTEPVKVYYWDSAIASREASDPAALETLRQFIIGEIGVDPQPYIPVAGATSEQLALLLSGNDPLDAFIGGSWRTYAASGLLQPINGLLEEYGQDILNNPGVTEMLWARQTDSEGKIWGVPRMPAHVLPRQLQVRTDWLEKYNLEMPTTISELENVLATFQAEDPSGDGTTIPLLTDWEDGFVYGFLGAYIDTGAQWFTDEDGLLKPYYLNSGYKEALKKFNEWYEAGYIHKEAFQLTGSQQKEFIQQDRVGVYLSWYSTICNSVEGLLSNNPDAFYGVATDITGDNGKGLQTYSKISENGHFFLARSENPDAMMRFINWQAAKYNEHIPNSILARYGTPELFNYEIYTIGEDGWPIYDTAKQAELLASQEFYFFYCPDRATTVRLYTDPYFEGKEGHSEYEWRYLQYYGYDPVPIENMGVKGDDYDFAPDTVAISDAVPFLSDINRMVEEEGIKFVTGQRSFDTYESFINDLFTAGLQDYIDEYNRQFQEIYG